MSRREAENWSTQAAEVRANARSIESELGQPFFAWLTTRVGADGREIGAAGAMRLASPQTTEDAEVLRAHAAAFIAERFPAGGGVEPAPVRAEFQHAREGLREAGGTDGAWNDWSTSVREKASGAGAPRPGGAGERAKRGRLEIETELDIREAGRTARAGVAGESIDSGRPKVAAETEKPLTEHVVRDLPVVGEWMGGKLYGTARNAAPEGAENKPGSTSGGKNESKAGFMGDQVMGP